MNPFEAPNMDGVDAGRESMPIPQMSDTERQNAEAIHGKPQFEEYMQRHTQEANEAKKDFAALVSDAETFLGRPLTEEEKFELQKPQ